ncbi:MAG: DUF6502 family protein [Steroidobacteraceae bacterium]
MAAARKRKRHRSEADAGSTQERAAKMRLGAELVGVCLAAVRPYGVDSAQVLRSPLTVKASTGRATFARKLFHDTYWLGELATEWTENPDYVDASGRPRVLAVYGQGATFAALVRRYFGARRLQPILKLALRTGVVEQVGSHKVAHVNACVMLTGQSTLLLARAVLCVRGLLSATQSNGLGVSKTTQLSPDRLACSFVPRESFGQFAGLMRPQLHNLVDQGNRWLSDHTVRDRPRDAEDRKGLMGVHAYVFRD